MDKDIEKVVEEYVGATIVGSNDSIIDYNGLYPTVIFGHKFTYSEISEEE